MHKLNFNLTTFFRLIAIALVLSFVFSQFFTNSANAAAGINRQINFQGKLVNNPLSTNVSNTSYTVVFTLYDRDTGGTVLWQETQSVTTTDGIFRVALGSVTPFPANFNFNWSGLYLGIKVNSDSEMTPRIQMAAVPFAFNSEKVAGLTVQDTSGNASTSGTLQVGNGKTISFADNISFGTGTTGTIALGSGTNTLTLLTTGNTSVTLPQSGTLCSITTCFSSDAFWNQNLGALFPSNSTVDFLVGGQSSTSAKFAITGISNLSNQVNASLSGQLIVMANNGWGGNATISGALTLGAFSNGVIQTTKNQLLTVGGNTTGHIQFKPGNSSSSLYLSSNGRVGLGTTAPSTQFHLKGTTGIRLEGTGTGTDIIDIVPGTASTFDRLDFIAVNTNRGAAFQLTPDGTSDQTKIALTNQSSQSSFGSVFLEVNGDTAYISPQNISTPTTSVSILQFGLGTGVNDEWSQILVTNGQFGIGNISPKATLHVTGAYGNNAALIVDQLNNGNLFTASFSGTRKFVIANTGLVSVLGGQTSDIDTLSATTLKIGTSTTNAITLGNNTVTSITMNVDTAGSFIFQKEGSVYTCSGTDKLTLNGSGQLICGTDQTGAGTGVNWWNQLAGALSPIDTANDFLIGGFSTTSAKFSYTGIQSGQTVASTSGNLVVMANNGWGGQIGVGTTSPVGPLDVEISASNFLRINKSTDYANLNFSSNGVGFNTSTLGFNTEEGFNLSMNNGSFGTLSFGSTAFNVTVATTQLNSMVGIGSFTPVSKLDVNSSVVGKALVTFNERGDQDILTASSGGTTKFVVSNGGNASIEGTLSDLSDATLAITDDISVTGTVGSIALKNVTQFNNTGDDLSMISFGDNYGANQVRILAERGAAGTGGDNPTDLSFWTIPDGSTTLTERMRIYFDGTIVLGTTTTGLSVNTDGVLTDLDDAAIAITDGLTVSGAIGANGGITFDQSTDTLGAHTLAGTVDANSNIITNIGSTGTDFDTSGGLNITTDAAGTALTVDNAANASSIFVAEDNNTSVFTIADGGNITLTGTITDSNSDVDITDGLIVDSLTIDTGDITWSGTTPSITINAAETFTISNGTAADNFAYNTSTNALTIGDGTNGLTFDIDTGMTYQGTGRKQKTITLSPEYPGAVLSAYYGAGTDTNLTGNMTSDTDTTQGTSIRNYYQWVRTTDATQHFYTVAVRVTLPKDFSTWATTNALVVNYRTQSATNTVSDLDVRVYNENSATIVASSTDQASTSWTTIAIDDSVLDDNTSSEWDAADETAVIYLRMGSASSNYVQIGDIQLNYMSAF